MQNQQVDLIPYQAAYLQDKTQHVLLHGGLGSGKSRGLVMDLYNQCARYPGAKYVLTANDYQQLRDSTHVEVVRYLQKIDCPYRYHKTDKIFTFPNGSSIHEITLEKPPEALKGPEWDGVYFDECDRTTEQHFDFLSDRARGKVGDRRIRAACNPVSPGHYLAVRFFVNPRAGHRGYEVSTYMNAVNLPADYIKRLENKYPVGTTAHARWMLGKIISIEGSVYPEFGPAHLIGAKDVPADAQVFCYGLDHGIVDPFVVLEAKLHGPMLYITREYYQPGLTIPQHAPNVQGMYVEGLPIIADHGAEKNQQMKDLGFNVVNAYKDVHEGITLTRQRFILDGIRIVADACPNLVRELYNYAWKRGVNQVKEVPEHTFSHAPDALRYLIEWIDAGSSASSMARDAMAALFD